LKEKLTEICIISLQCFYFNYFVSNNDTPTRKTILFKLEKIDALPESYHLTDM